MASNGNGSVIDLDVLRPDPRVVRLGGNDIDVSFVPSGLTFELEQIVQDMTKLSVKDIEGGDREQVRKGFDLAIDLCSLFCQHRYPEMTREWFLANTDAGQLQVFAESIKDALIKSYEGVKRYQQSPPKAKTKK